MRIAMWSGPRNLSTAMMYAFGNRTDFAVQDEAFYAPYLARTGLDHPMKSEILSHHETDPDLVAATCKGTIPGGKSNLYMKHMAHHMLPGFPLDWALACQNLHLIRHPARVVASYGAKRAAATLDDIGYPQQAEIYAKVGGLVIDSHAIRANPDRALRRICNAIGLEFDPAMLWWPKGPHRSDGIWASHWYGAVHDSTGFAGPEGDLPDLDAAQIELTEAAMPYYTSMRQSALDL